MRKEARRDKMNLLKSVREDSLRSAHERETNAHTLLKQASDRLDSQLKTLKVPFSVSSDDEHQPKPCESFRVAVTDCYRRNVETGDILACTSEVRAFTECAKQLCDISSKK